MNVDLSVSLGWVSTGTQLCRAAIDRLDAAGYDGPSLLPGWTRRHVIAHLALNANALCNLTTWARTQVPRSMYASAQERSTGIEHGARLTPDKLARFFEESADSLTKEFAGLDTPAWRTKVQTAQGRTIPASDIPWLRAREVMVHAVDLDAGVSFGDLPDGFLTTLMRDISDKRGADSLHGLRGPLPEIAAYLAGRPHSGVVTVDGSSPPALGPWL